MHEWSIVESLLREADRHARAHRAHRVRRLRLRIGALAGVEVALLERAYACFRERSCCEQAALEVESVPARWRCVRCARDLAPGRVLRCDRCGGPVRLTSGDEIVLAQIELEMEASPVLAKEIPDV